MWMVSTSLNPGELDAAYLQESMDALARSTRMVGRADIVANDWMQSCCETRVAHTLGAAGAGATQSRQQKLMLSGGIERPFPEHAHRNSRRTQQAASQESGTARGSRGETQLTTNLPKLGYTFL
jgi:hypothetical protein